MRIRFEFLRPVIVLFSEFALVYLRLKMIINFHNIKQNMNQNSCEVDIIGRIYTRDGLDAHGYSVRLKEFGGLFNNIYNLYCAN